MRDEWATALLKVTFFCRKRWRAHLHALCISLYACDWHHAWANPTRPYQWKLVIFIFESTFQRCRNRICKWPYRIYESRRKTYGDRDELEKSLMDWRNKLTCIICLFFFSFFSFSILCLCRFGEIICNFVVSSFSDHCQYFQTLKNRNK